MEKVFNAFATRRGVAVGSLRFLLDGEKIGIDQTPKMLELEDQDQIDCMLEQVRFFGSRVSLLFRIPFPLTHRELPMFRFGTAQTGGF
jgi:small ubiquitin-related modifier